MPSACALTKLDRAAECDDEVLGSQTAFFAFAVTSTAYETYSEQDVKRNFRSLIRPLLFGIAFALAATTVYAKPRSGGCSGGDELLHCVEAGLPVSLCCAVFGM